MTQAWRLGLQLARGATGAARLRSLAMLLVAVLATVLLLATAAITRAAWARLHVGWSPEVTPPVRLDDVLALSLVVVGIVVSVGTLVATVSQLSARLREQRLANLRLLGLAPGQTRMVAVAEVGAFALLGWVLGELLFLALRPLLALVGLGGQPYAVEQLSPRPLDHLLVALLVPGLVIVLGALRRAPARQELLVARSFGEGPRPGWWRTLPLVVGAGLCLWLIGITDAAREAGETVPVGGREIALLVGGVLLSAVGMLLVVPVFVRLIADLLTQVSARPALLVAGRRLQAQPTAMTRVVGALLVALFLATSSLAVLATFRATPQFERVHRMVTVEQSTTLAAEVGEVDQVVARAEAVGGVRRASPVHFAATDCRPAAISEESSCETQAWIGTCEDLRAAVSEISGCRGDVVQEIGYGRWLDPGRPAPTELVLWARGYELEVAGGESGEFTILPPRGPSAVVPLPSGPAIEAPEWGASFFGGAVFVPSGLPGVEELLTQTPAELRVVAEPGRDLFDNLAAAGLEYRTGEDFRDYDRVLWMGQVVRGLSVLFVSLGILSFGLAALDRAIERRREVISLQLLGAPGHVLRVSQWIEVALPLVLGCGLAVWLGSVVGDAFLGLALSDLPGDVGIRQMWPALAAALIGAVLVGLLTSVAANPRIRPELIRSE